MHDVKWKYIVLSAILAAITYFLPLGLGEGAHRMLFIMVFIALLWVTEAAPLHATAILGAFLLVLILNLKPETVFGNFFDPVIVLLLGGFVIAVAMSKHRLDEYVAYKIISRDGGNPRLTVLALLATTVFISMWISNTAAAAIIMPIALVLLVKNKFKPGKSNFGKACVLAVGYGATIGGIGTIIGSTPNIIATKFLHQSGISFEFFDWFYRGFPFMVILTLVAWLTLVTLFKPEKKVIKTVASTHKINSQQKKVAAIFALTVVLWVTEGIHGVSSGVVALVPIILFFFTGILDSEDINKVDWSTLLLVGGGIALGMGIHSTGLDAAFATMLSTAVSGQGTLFFYTMLALFGVLMTILISNTTAAAIYLPIVVALASSFGASPANAVTVAAIGVSLDFIFPFGTPPTAIAYGTKYVGIKDIVKAGLVIALMGAVLLSLITLTW